MVYIPISFPTKSDDEVVICDMVPDDMPTDDLQPVDLRAPESIASRVSRVADEFMVHHAADISLGSASFPISLGDEDDELENATAESALEAAHQEMFGVLTHELLELSEILNYRTPVSLEILEYFYDQCRRDFAIFSEHKHLFA